MTVRTPKPLDIVRLPLPFLLHIGWVELDSDLGPADVLLVLHRDKDWLQLTRGPAEIPKRCATRRRHVLWLENRQQTRNGAQSFVLVLCRHHYTLHELDDC